MITKHNNMGNFNIILSTLEDLVPQDHIVRKYDTAIDWKFIYPIVEPLYSSTTGRPSIDPIVLFKLVLLNYLEGIHSLRKTCERCKTDVAYRWFLRINFDDKIPDHSTFSQNLSRKFLNTDVFDKIFHKILVECYKAGFIDNENVFGDGTHVKASANKKKHLNKVVKETEKIYKEDLLKDINVDRIEHGKKAFVNKDDDNDTPNSNNTDNSNDELTKSDDLDDIIDSTEDKIIKFDKETGELIEKDSKIKFKTIKTSTTDPDAGFYHKGEHEKMFAYSTSAFCDKNGFILDYYVTAGNIHDSVSFYGLYEKFKKSFLFKTTLQFVLDAGYTAPSILKTIIDDNKNILVPYVRPKTKDGFFKKYEYVYDEYNDAYICPNNEMLYYSTTNKEGYREYKSNPLKCCVCPMKNKCTHSRNNQKVITQHVWNEYQELALDNRYKIGNKEIYNLRKETIERCFADGKENFGLRYTRYRGIKRVTQGLSLLLSCMNFKRLARWKAMA